MWHHADMTTRPPRKRTPSSVDLAVLSDPAPDEHDTAEITTDGPRLPVLQATIGHPEPAPLPDGPYEPRAVTSLRLHDGDHVVNVADKREPGCVHLEILPNGDYPGRSVSLTWDEVSNLISGLRSAQLIER